MMLLIATTPSSLIASEVGKWFSSHPATTWLSRNAAATKHESFESLFTQLATAGGHAQFVYTL